MAALELGEDDVLWRWAAYALFYDWRDEGCSLRVLPREALAWMAGDRYRKDFKNTEEVIEYVAERLPDVEVAPCIPARRHRLIITDGLSPHLFRVVERDRMRSKQEYEKRVIFSNGKRWFSKEATAHRKALKALADELLANAPTATSRYVCERLNDRLSRTQSKVLRFVGEAREVVRSMRINVAVRRKRDEVGDWCESWSEARARARRQRRDLRRYYHRVLDSIEEQHQQFYAPSKRGRTDRVFAINHGVLLLPKRVRTILLQDYHEIDLSSAHLRIAASLWGAERLLEALDDDAFSIWTELAEHLGLELTESVKGALKAALYSAVYGMKRPNIQGGLNRKLNAGRKPQERAPYGQRFMEHPLIVELLEARDRELALIEGRGFAVTPDGLMYHVVTDGPKARRADARSCLASVAQHVEQELMRVVLEYEAEERVAKRFQVAFWIHDGCFVNINRSTPTHLKNLNERLQARAQQLRVRAKFDHTPPRASAPATPTVTPTPTRAETPCHDTTDRVAPNSSPSSEPTTTKATAKATTTPIAKARADRAPVGPTSAPPVGTTTSASSSSSTRTTGRAPSAGSGRATPSAAGSRATPSETVGEMKREFEQLKDVLPDSI